MYQEEEEDEEEKEERGNKFKRVTPLTLEYMRTKMFYISERKHRKREPDPTPSSSGRMYTRKNPDLREPCPSGDSTNIGRYVPVTTLAATCLTYLDFRLGLFSFLDPAKAVEIARLKQWTGNLLKKHGLQDRGERREEEKS